MYWCKSNTLNFIGLMVLLLMACKPSSSNNAAGLSYFDIHGYFKGEAEKLNMAHPKIKKTAVHNKDTTIQNVNIKNWLTELASFIESDINKTAWKNSYRVEQSDNFIIYNALEKSLRTRKILIKLENNKVIWIMIENHTKNTLYTTYEKLSYFPDSHYEIKKTQQVRLLGNNRYYINGQLKH